MKNRYAIAVLALIVGLTIGAFAGMKYEQNQGANLRQGQFNGQRGNFQRSLGQSGGNMMGRGAVIGEIISLDDKSITVKLQDGSSKIVLLPSSVTVSKTDTGSKNDLKTGVNVAVFGTTNSDGSVTASNVQLNPMFRGGGQGTPSANPK